MPAMNCSPWMIESAHRYLCAAELLRYQLLDVAQVNAALGMEILLKSFVSTPDDRFEKSDQTYERNDELIQSAHENLKASGAVPDKPLPDRHDLLTLFHAVPEQIRRQIGLDHHELRITRYRHVFTKSRYPYEKNTQRGSSSALILVLGDMIPRVIEFYQAQGCEDPFIQGYSRPEVEVGLFLTEADLDPLEDEI